MDTEAVLEVAGIKWNFLLFRPGLFGGHCIGVYLDYHSTVNWLASRNYFSCTSFE